jgi:hypothetical protein
MRRLEVEAELNRIMWAVTLACGAVLALGACFDAWRAKPQPRQGMHLSAPERETIADSAPGLVTSLKYDRDLGSYACAMRYQLMLPNGLSLLLVGSVYGQTRSGALALAFEMLSRELLRMHLSEWRRE